MTCGSLCTCQPNTAAPALLLHTNVRCCRRLSNTRAEQVALGRRLPDVVAVTAADALTKPAAGAVMQPQAGACQQRSSRAASRRCIRAAAPQLAACHRDIRHVLGTGAVHHKRQHAQPRDRLGACRACSAAARPSLTIGSVVHAIRAMPRRVPQLSTMGDGARGGRQQGRRAAAGPSSRLASEAAAAASSVSTGGQAAGGGGVAATGVERKAGDSVTEAMPDFEASPGTRSNSAHGCMLETARG